MTNLSLRAARIFAYPVLKANPCNEIRCQQGPVKGAANLCASRHRHIYSTEGNALAARRTAKGFYLLLLTVTSSFPLTNKKKQPLAYRGICIRRRHILIIPYNRLSVRPGTPKSTHLSSRAVRIVVSPVLKASPFARV